MSSYSRDFWSFGTSTIDYGTYLSQDSSGYIYIPFRTNQSGFTVSGSFQKTTNSSDAFLIKFDSFGNPIYGQNIASVGSFTGNTSYVDGLNNSYLVGYAGGSGFTISGLGITRPDGLQAYYFIQFNASGNSVWAKLIGGVVGGGTLPSITSDLNNNIFFTTIINSSGFSISGFGPFNKTNTIQQSVILKYDNAGNALWSTFLGSDSGNTSGTCVIRSVLTDSSSNLYAIGSFGNVSGIITFSGFNPIIKTDNSTDALILKYDSSGNPLWAKMFGGAGGEILYSGTIDSSGNLYVVGETNSSGFTVSGLPSFNKVTTNQDTFLLKLNSSGIPLFGTLITGSGSEIPNSVKLDAKNNIYVLGTTNTSGFTVSGLPDFGKTDNVTDGFLIKYNSSGVPKWGTLLNASGNANIASNILINSNKIIVSAFAQAHRLFYRNIDAAPTSAYFPILFKTNANGLPLMSKMFGTTIGSGWGWTGIKCDSSGSIFAGFRTPTSGFTISGFLPKIGTFNTHNIVKLNSSGFPLNVAYVDYYNGADLTTDVSNNVLSVGNTTTSGFTVSGLPAFNKTNTQQNGVFLKNDNSLNPLWGVLMGVSGSTSATGCAADSSGNIYIVGQTNQCGFSVSGLPSFNKTSSTTTGYLLKYSPSGDPLWGELISNQASNSHKITCDSSGFLYVAGITSVSGFTISGLPLSPNQKTNGDVFMIKYDSSGIPIWQTFPAGSGGGITPNTVVAGNNFISMVGGTSQCGYTISGWIDKVNLNNGIAEIRFSKDGTIIYAKYIADNTVSAGPGQASVMITPQDDTIVGSYGERSTFTICGMPNMRGSTTSDFKSFIAKYDSSGNNIFGRLYSPANTSLGYFWMNNFTLGNDNSILGLGFGSSGNHYGYADNDAYVVTYTQQTTAPEAPSAVTVLSHSNGVASVGWTDGDDNGATITSYTITGNPGGSAVVATNPGTISGLIDGVTYTFTVQATNSAGTGIASAPSAASTSPSAGASAVQNVASNPAGITDYMATQTSKPADVLALEMRATIQNAGLSAADAVLATAQYIKGMRAKIGGGVVSVTALDTSDYATFVSTLTSSTMTTRPIDLLYPDYGNGTTASISLQYAATDNSKYYAVEVPNGYSINVISGSVIVNIQFRGTFATANGKTYGLGDTITIGTKSLLLTGFGSLAYLVQNVGSGSADPYITNIDGLHYKLPNFDGPIRFYQGEVENKLLTVNVSLRTIASKELFNYSFESYLKLKNEISPTALANIEKQMQKKETLTFFDTVYIKYDNAYITLNVWDSEIRVVNHNGNIPCKVELAQISEESQIYNKYKGKTLKLRFGTATVNVSVYTSPLIRNGLSITAPNMKAGNGILVNAMNSQTMKLPDLSSTQSLSKNDTHVKRKLEKEFYVDNGGYREKHVIVLK